MMKKQYTFKLTWKTEANHAQQLIAKKSSCIEIF